MKKINVTFLPSHISVEGEFGEKITDVALKAGLDIPMACGGNCACSTCRIIVKEGSLGGQSDMEEMWGLPDGQRLGCQATLENDDVVIELPD